MCVWILETGAAPPSPHSPLYLLPLPLPFPIPLPPNVVFIFRCPIPLRIAPELLLIFGVLGRGRGVVGFVWVVGCKIVATSVLVLGLS